MTRPAPIAAIDDVLAGAVAALDTAHANVGAFLDEHIATIDAYRAVVTERGNAEQTVRQLEDALYTLGYSILDANGQQISSHLDGRNYNKGADEDAARQRAGEATP